MRHEVRRRRAPAAVLLSTALICGLVQSQAWADPAPAAPSAPAGAQPAGPSQIAPADRDQVLGKEWKNSTDRAWTTSSDVTGFHILVADKKAGYGWRTAASLAEPGFDTDMWVGNACVTGSGKRAVVAYAPRTFTNKPELMARGAFTAIVDLDSGAVTKLKEQGSLAYFSPGCGTGESAVFTQSGGETRNATRLLEVDAASAKVATPIELPGQVTSAVPVGKDIVAADGARLSRIDSSGRLTPIARTAQVPFALAADSDGGVVYMDRLAGSGDKAEVRRVSSGDISRGDDAKAKPPVLAKGALTQMDVTASAQGKVFITGASKPAQELPGSVKRRPDIPKDSVPSTQGDVLVTKVAWADGVDPRAKTAVAPRAANIDVTVVKTAKQAKFTVTPPVPDDANRPASGLALSPALAATAPAAPQAKSGPSALAAAPAVDATAEPDAYCSVPRNNPRKQATQPKPRQVEWAVNRAITNTLNMHISRPSNWKNLGMGAYQPQSLFPLTTLEGGGRIPAQVMLGITAQESNMWQASRVVVPGVTGNSLIGNFYGIKYSASGTQNDPWAIDWAEADCGYGVTQVTDGMRMHGKEKPGERALSTLQQEAVALDYTANIAAGVNILADKWNITRKDGLVANNGDPKWVENWFFALWAYNSGYYPKADAGQNGGLWGVGFTNNPANPLWKANRTPFLENASGKDDYSHAAHPQDWPYQEKVIGWAARPLEALESPGKMVSGFRYAWWSTPALRTASKPAEGLFCTAANSCDPSKIGPDDKNDPGLGACTREDLKCWWNQPVQWKDCTKNECGNETFRFNDTYPEELDGAAYPPNCNNTLPGNAVIVDDVPGTFLPPRGGCSMLKASTGTFDLDFATPNAKIDFQQLGGGYGGHFWFAHTRKAGADDRMTVTGTWKLGQQLDSDAKVWVHMPDHGAHTTQAVYEVLTTQGWVQRTASQPSMVNRWVSLGAFRFQGVSPQVRLSSITADGTGDQDIAFDAVAFEPGNFSDVPQVTFPDADENASDEPYDTAPDQPESLGSKTSLSSLSSAPSPASLFLKQPRSPQDPLVSLARKPKEQDCKPIEGRKGEELCYVRKDVVQKPAAPAPAPAPAPGARFAPQSLTGPGVGNPDPLCYRATTLITLTRDASCTIQNHLWTRNKDGVPAGTLSIRVIATIALDNRSGKFEQKINISRDKHDAFIGPINVNVRANCSGPCSSDPMQWSGVPDWVPGDPHSATASIVHTWTNSNGKDVLNPTWGLSVTMAGKKSEVDFSDPQLRVRCDDVTKGTKDWNKTGCVFPEYTPSYLVNSVKYPSAAALYWVFQEKLPNHPGSKKHNSPLRYLGPGNMKGTSATGQKIDQTNQLNRNVICPSSGPYKWVGINNWSCDEYAFAITHESGGMPGGPNQVSDPTKCVTLFAEKSGGVNPTWTIKDDLRFAPPTWTERCGRGSILVKENTGAASRIGTIFVPTKRMLDEDPFFVSTPGFEDCSISTVCVMQPRP
ncbi:hypothetical protein ACIQNK_21085 [Streptomyces sp. NPDC091273]|uniref:golvesin C-terminal-like domain-containing protein n=1 Tax=Streptomyces sp. NPDC091273 TaxID=3365982 RepID=UPI00380CDD54